MTKYISLDEWNLGSKENKCKMEFEEFNWNKDTNNHLYKWYMTNSYHG